MPRRSRTLRSASSGKEAAAADKSPVWWKGKRLNYTYILRCGDGSLYTGWTNDLEHRVKVHQSGKGGKYTRSRLPVELVYYEEWEDKIQAMKREAAIKKLNREKKEELVRQGSSSVVTD